MLRKTVGTVFTPKSRRPNGILSSEICCFRIGETRIQFVDSFKYLGHYVASDLSDDNTILPEICMFFCTNNLSHRFSKCSVNFKAVLLRSY